MDIVYTQALVEVGISLVNLISQQTNAYINSKIASIKDEKNAEKIRSIYDEIINRLILEKEEALRIAQTYKSELDRINISDQDIEHLERVVGNLLGIIKEMSPHTDIKAYEQFQKLISADTLKAMQLLGFNYKEAIGEPLTQLCSNFILSKGQITPRPQMNQQNSGKNQKRP